MGQCQGFQECEGFRAGDRVEVAVELDRAVFALPVPEHAGRFGGFAGFAAVGVEGVAQPLTRGGDFRRGRVPSEIDQSLLGLLALVDRHGVRDGLQRRHDLIYVQWRDRAFGGGFSGQRRRSGNLRAIDTPAGVNRERPCHQFPHRG
nr:hypothetical protein [Amycolatopsis sp. CA-230715]